MDTIYKDFLAFWGAGLSTLLGVAQFLKHFKDKPKISVDAGFIYKTCGEKIWCQSLNCELMLNN